MASALQSLSEVEARCTMQMHPRPAPLSPLIDTSRLKHGRAMFRDPVWRKMGEQALWSHWEEIAQYLRPSKCRVGMIRPAFP